MVVELDMMCNKIRITRVLWIGTTGPKAQYVVDCLPACGRSLAVIICT